MSSLPTPPPAAIFFEDDKIYACLASFPLSRGHCIVAWKDDVSDLNLLGREDYEYLMDAVEKTRKVIMKALQVEKVYLLYMDEVNHVHWHLVPRYRQKGYTVLNHKAEELENFDLAAKMKRLWYEN